MEQINFDVQIRKNTGSARARQVRRSNLIPGIVYGGNSKPTTIQADRKAYDRIYRQHAGESLIYHLNLVDEGKKSRISRRSSRMSSFIRSPMKSFILILTAFPLIKKLRSRSRSFLKARPWVSSAMAVLWNI